MNDDEITIINNLIGKPYELGSMGPDTFDCWGLTRHIQRVIFQRDLQVLETKELYDVRALVRFIRNNPAHKNWTKVEEPEHGSLVEMSNSIHPHHVGVYLNIDGGGIIHGASTGVIFDTIFNLKTTGWRNFIFYKYVDTDITDDS